MSDKASRTSKPKSTPQMASKSKPKAKPKAPTPSIKPIKQQKRVPSNKSSSASTATASAGDKKANKKGATATSSTGVTHSDKERHRVLAALQPGDDDPDRLVRDYPFKAKSLEFREKFDALIGRSYVWVPRSPDTFHELLGVISQMVAFLGFQEASISSSHSAQYSAISSTAEPIEGGGLDLSDARLSLLWIRPPEYSWSQLRNFLVYRQVDSQHEGIINKWLLIANLKDSDQRLKYKTGEGHRFSSKHFLPETVSLDMPLDELISMLATYEGTYIIKEVRGTKGQNMNLLRLKSGSNSHKDLLEMLKGTRLLQHRLNDVILQKYIERPLLVDKRKFDFRVYMLMVNACRKETSNAKSTTGTPAVKKAFYVYYHPGFLRLCIMAYQRDSPNLLCHLTNQHVQMRSILYDQYKEATVWEPDELNRYFNTKGSLPAKDFIRNVIYPKIGAIIGYLGAVFADSLNDTAILANTFKMFGVDFLVDSKLSVQLLEVNELPSWKRQTKVLSRLKTDLWREAVAIATETVASFRQAGKSQPAQPPAGLCNFRLVHSSEQPQLLAESIAKNFA